MGCERKDGSRTSGDNCPEEMNAREYPPYHGGGFLFGWIG